MPASIFPEKLKLSRIAFLLLPYASFLRLLDLFGFKYHVKYLHNIFCLGLQRILHIKMQQRPVDCYCFAVYQYYFVALKTVIDRSDVGIHKP